MKKAVCTLIFIIMFISVFFSCSKEKGNDKITDSESVTVNTTTGTVESEVKPDLPDKDLNNLEWNVFGYQPVTENSFYVEEPKSEIISEAIYNSITEIEDRYCVDITMTYSGMTPENQSIKIKSLVDTGDTTYSLFELHDAIGTNDAIEGYFYNLYEVPYLTLDTPWWHNIEDMTLYGNVFSISSDISLIDLKQAWCLFFNKDIMNAKKVEFPYKKVLDGEWTLDELIKITKDVYEDLNKDNHSNKGDLFGFECIVSMYGWLDSFGIQTTTKDSDGNLTIMQDVDKVNSIVEKMYGWLRNSVGAKDSGKPNISDTDGFMNGEYMIFMQALANVDQKFRFSDSLKYGILPMPKWDEKDEYITSCLTYPFWIPSNLSGEQLENVGLLVEALSYQGYKEVVPAYYERALKEKYNPDMDFSKMITIIHDSLRPSFAWCYESWKGMYFTLYDCFTSYDGHFMTYYGEKKNMALARIDDINKLLGMSSN